MREVTGLLQVVEAIHLDTLARDLVGDLVAPFVDDGHVDVIDEDGHAPSARGSVRAAHALVDVALHRALNKSNHIIIINQNIYMYGNIMSRIQNIIFKSDIKYKKI